MKAIAGSALLFALIFATAVHLVVVRYEHKRLYMELHSLRHQQDELEQERSQLLLEQGTAGAHLRVEGIARTKLNMTPPNTGQLMRVYP